MTQSPTPARTTPAISARGLGTSPVAYHESLQTITGVPILLFLNVKENSLFSATLTMNSNYSIPHWLDDIVHHLG